MAFIFPRIPEWRVSARRRTVVYVTWYSEYHCVGRLCVGVRDLDTGQFVQDHPAVGRNLSGVIRATADGALLRIPDASPSVGDQLHFSGGKSEDNVQTSPVRKITRSRKHTLRRSFN